MKVKVMNKINKEGNLRFCVIDKDFPDNRYEIDLYTYEKFNKIKTKKYYTIYNIGIKLNKDNEVPLNCKTNIDEKIIELDKKLIENGLEIIEKKSLIEYKSSPILRSQRDSCDSCKFLDCF
jgi:hypothetical protein